MSAPQDNDKPVSDPQQEPVRTFDLDHGDVSNDETPTPDRDEIEVHPPPKDEPAPPARPGTQLAPAKQGWLGRIIRPRSRREQQLQTLQSGYLEMLEMMRSIRTHLDQQVQTQEKLVESLQHFPDAVDGLKHIGEATAQQTEVLGMVREQLEQTAQHEEEIVGSMNSFNKTLNQMDETSRNSTQTVNKLVEKSRDSEAALREMMERSEKRMATLTGLMGFLALAAVGFALFVVFDDKQGGDGHAADHAPAAAVGEPAAEPVPAVADAGAEEPAPSEAAVGDDPQPDVEEPLSGLAKEPEATEEAVEEGDDPQPDVEEPLSGLAEEPEATGEPVEPETDEGEPVGLDDDTTQADVAAEDVEVTALDVMEAAEEVPEEVEEVVEEVVEAASEVSETAGEPVDEVEGAAAEDIAEPAAADSEPTDSAADEAPETDAEETNGMEDVDATVEEAAADNADRPGVKGVVRRVFSFLGNDSETAAAQPEPVIGDLTEALTVAEDPSLSE